MPTGRVLPESAVQAGHICWSVDGDDSYLSGAESLLRYGRDQGLKTLLFGPDGSEPLRRLGRLASATLDPAEFCLHGRSLDTEAILDKFGAEQGAALAGGYGGVFVVADMDWLLPAGLSPASVLEFELRLDRQIRELGATVVCAYRTARHDPAAGASVRCVHPGEVASGEPVQFRLVAAERGWRLSGEVDLSMSSYFRLALEAAVSVGGRTIDISELRFIDASGLREIAEVAASGSLELRGARPLVRRSWAISGYADHVPAVQLVG